MQTGGEMEKEQSKEEIKLRWTRSRKVGICGPSLLQAYPPKEKNLCSSLLLHSKGQHKEPGYSPADDLKVTVIPPPNLTGLRGYLDHPSHALAGIHRYACFLR